MFQATPASMANLMKKLETVDDEGGSSASNQSQPTTKHSRQILPKVVISLSAFLFFKEKTFFDWFMPTVLQP